LFFFELFCSFPELNAGIVIKRRFSSPALLLICVFFVLVLLNGGGGAEPRYNGKRLSACLLTGVDRRGSYGITEEGWKALKATGTNAVPVLLSMMQSQDGIISKRLASAFNRNRYMPFYLFTAYDKHVIASMALQQLKPEPSLVVPVLGKLIMNPDSTVRLLALECLNSLEPPRELLLPILVQNLREIDDPIRSYDCASCVRNLYPEDGERIGIYKRFPYLRPEPENQ
jgi:hypothetical protein